MRSSSDEMTANARIYKVGSLRSVRRHSQRSVWLASNQCTRRPKQTRIWLVLG